MVLKASDNSIIGCNNHTLVTEDNGRHWVTREPAIVYFHKKYWFNVVAMLQDDGIVYYCNLASPYVLDREALKYIDYDLDVKVYADGHRRLLDVDEYEMFSRRWQYGSEIDHILKRNVKILIDWIDNQKGPFSDEFISIWFNRYLDLSR